MATVVKTKATKAIVGSVISGVVAALSVLASDLSGPTDWSSAGTYLSIILAGLVGAGLVGAGVYNTTNAPQSLAK